MRYIRVFFAQAGAKRVLPAADGSGVAHSALVHAARAGHTSTVAALLQNIEVSHSDQGANQKTRAHGAAAQWRGQGSSSGQNEINIGVGPLCQTALALACAGGHEEVANKLLDAGADLYTADKSGCTPMAYAIAGDHETVVMDLIEEVPSEKRGAFLATALQFAAATGQEEMIDTAHHGR